MKKSKHLSIRTAFMLLVFLAIMPALVIIIWSGTEFSRHMEEEARLDVLRQAEAFSEIQIRISEETRQLLATLAALPEFRAFDTEEIKDILRSVHAQNPSYLNLTVVDSTGVIAASSLLDAGISLSERKHIQNALVKGHFSGGEYVIGLVDEAPSFPYSYPITDYSGAVIGAISTLYRIDSYAAVFEQFLLPDGAFLGLVDYKGIRLFHHPAKPSNLVGKPIKADVWEIISSSADQNIFTETGSDGVERYFYYKKLKLSLDQSPYMYVVYGSPTEAASRTSRAILLRNIIIMFLVLLFALGLAWALSHYTFARRLQAIVNTADAIRLGNLNERVTIQDDSPDLGRIISALNLMAETIEHRHSELETYSTALAQALEEKGILLKEIHHRVKNNLQIILSMFRLQGDTSSDPAVFMEAMETRIATMALVHEMLYETENNGEVNLSTYAEKIVELSIDFRDMQGLVNLETDIDPIYTKLDKAVPFGLLLNELTTNCLKHAFKGRTPGVLMLTLKNNPDGSTHLMLADNGPGLPEGFDLKTSSRLGMHLTAALASQLGGELRWENNGGARFYVDIVL